ncbi:Hypothetical protein DHA2_16037 [Giardia duodenalis]|uniref:Uncharacterized protein n=1 Tax=Giardia intestinalis TaxID=5741 RepID=V6TLF9_GIAIN|nr:Hypothetical protein DHA2_16037 [Giardia intestinalis]
MADAPTAAEQLELRQNAELLRTDVLREEVAILMDSIQVSASSSRNSQRCIQLVANELIRVIMNNTASPSSDGSVLTTKKADLPANKDLTTTVDIFILRQYPFLMPAGFSIDTLDPAIGELRVPLDPVSAPSVVSPWINGICGNVPGSTTMYVDIAIPIASPNQEIFEETAHFLVQAAYLAGILHHRLIPSLRLLDSHLPTRNVATYAKGDNISSALYDSRVVNLGISYQENSLMQPLLGLYLDASDYLHGLADVQMPISRNMIFRLVPQIVCAQNATQRLNTLHSKRFAAPFVYGDPREDVVAPSFSLLSQTTLSIDYVEVVNAACALLTTPTLQQVAMLFYTLLVLHGAAPRVHLNPWTIEMLDSQQSIFYDQDTYESPKFKESYGFSGTYPSHGLTLLSAIAVVAHVLRSSDILINCTDAATGLRVLLTHISESHAYLIPPEYAASISSYMLLSHNDRQKQSTAEQYTLASWVSAGSPLLLMVTKSGLLYNYLHNVTLGTWKHVLRVIDEARSLFLDSSLCKSTFQLYPTLFQTTNFTSAGSNSIFGYPGYDVILSMRLNKNIFADPPLLPTLLSHFIEGIIFKALGHYANKVTDVSCVIHWGVHATCCYKNNLHTITPDMLRSCFNSTSNAELSGPLYDVSQPHILVLMKLAPFALAQTGTAIHRGPSILSQKNDADLYSRLFDFSIDKEKMLDKRRFADGDMCVCTKWERGVSVEKQLHNILKGFVRHNFSHLIRKMYIRDSSGLVDVAYPNMSTTLLLSEMQVLSIACEHIQAALQAASLDCTDLPVNIVSIAMSDEYGRLSSVDSPAYILYLDKDPSHDQIPFNNRCITGTMILQNRDAWPKDPGAIACLKLLVMNMLMTHIQTKRPSLHSSAVLKAADVGYKTSIESYLVDNVAYTSYIPSDSKMYLRGSCLDIFMPIRHIDKQIYGKELPDFLAGSSAGGHRGIAFRFFIALPQDQSYYSSSSLRTYKIKEQYYNTIYNILPAHAVATRALSQQSAAYCLSVLLAKRWINAHLVPTYSLTHLFIDSAENPVTSRVVTNLYKRLCEEKITKEEFLEMIQADDQEISDSEDDDAPPRLVKSAFTLAREEVSQSHTLVPPSARAYMGFMSEEAIELIVAFIFTQHTRDGKTSIASPLVGFRLFLAFLIESSRGLGPMEKEYDTFGFMRQWYYEGVNDPEYSTYCTTKGAGDSAESYSNFVMDIYRETMPGRGRQGHRSWKSAVSDDHSSKRKRNSFKYNYVSVTDVVVDHNVALGQGCLSNKEYELLYNTGNRIIAKNTKLYSSLKDTKVLYSSGVGKLSTDAMLSAAIPPVLLRTVYDPSGALFTSSINKDLLKRLGSYALLSLRALDAYTVAESPVVHLQALFSTSIDHISAILEVNDVMHMTIRCDGEDREFAPVPSSVLANKAMVPRHWVSCATDSGSGCNDLLFFNSLRESLTEPPIGYNPVPLCMPIFARSLGSNARLHFDSQAATRVGLELAPSITQQEKLSKDSVEKHQLLYRVPDPDGNYIFSKELFIEGSLAETGRLFKLGVLTSDIVPVSEDNLEEKTNSKKKSKKVKKIKT